MDYREESARFPVDAGRQHTMLRNLSWPAVSHSCSLTFSPSLYTFFVTKNAPVVDVVFLGSNFAWVYRCNKLVFPTPDEKERRGNASEAGWPREKRRGKLTSVAHDHNLSIDSVFIH